MIDYKGSTESISRAIPIVLNHIQFSVFPEGGDLVDGIESNVAFRGLNEYGKPADIEGEILDEKNNTITKFASYHQGMGVFTLTPHKDQTYHIQITKPEGITESFPVPEALQRGYVLNIERCREGDTWQNPLHRRAECEARKKSHCFSNQPLANWRCADYAF
jgi:hypothetical protein